MKCPCDPSRLYENCCKKVHQHIFLATTAEQLMRSRYSAFVLGNIAFLKESCHSSIRPKNKEAQQIENWTNSVNWIKLVVLHSMEGLNKDSTGAVAFKAFYIENNNVEMIYENSRFCKENGHWVYRGIQGE
ncbi:YchJ family metal-binding protein [Nonlabens sp.]|uniref:YchJ family protein n=1 Tax=Nonlabens sp. TaxID=1888209 RepID=UPI001BCC870C|nr:YchJ family metal-binding protein [Nonlabens sp.]